MAYTFKIPPGTKLGYKIIGFDQPELETFNQTQNFNFFKKNLSKTQKTAFSGQTDHDWSATYSAFRNFGPTTSIWSFLRCFE